MVPTGFDLASTFVHLGRGGRAVPVADFEWSAGFLADYERRFAADGDDGRLVMLLPQTASWDHWERHPAGDELVVVLSGRVGLIQEIDGTEQRTELSAGQAAINPPGVWHTADVVEPGTGLFVTNGRGTEHRPRVQPPTA